MRVIKWRLLITLVALVIGVCQLTPWMDKAYDGYLLSQVRNRKEIFQKVLEDAQHLVKGKNFSNLIQALTAVCHDKQLDLSTCFTQFNIADIKNLDKRNRILLQHLLHQSKSVFKQGLDLKGGVAFLLRIHPQVLEGKSNDECQRMVQKAIEVILSRIDALGIMEPVARPRGRGNIEVQLPGISLESNPDVVQALKKPAKLDFRTVLETASDSDTVPLGYEKLFLTQEDEQGQEVQMPIVVKKVPEMTGKFIKEAHPMVDSYGKYEVCLQMTSAGKERFATITRQHLHQRLAIVLDGKVCSAPVIQSEITQGQASISGRFTQREAIELSNVLNNPLEFELELAEIYEIGPSLAESAKNLAIQASIISLILVMILMIVYYRTAGVVSSMSLILNFIFILTSWVVLGATITLPSITALALTFGMAVDANVLILERVREEIRAGRTSDVALEIGHEKAFSSILDSNLTTLLTAALLIFLGTGSVKGFGITLAIGVLTTLFTVLYFSRATLNFLSYKGRFRLSMNTWLGSAHYDFMRYRLLAFQLSAVLLVVGLIAFSMRGKGVLGIDFAGGDELLVRGTQAVDGQAVYDLIKAHHLGEINVVYQKQSGNVVPLLKIQTEQDRGEKILEVLQTNYPEAKLECISYNKMGASVSSDVQKNALLSIAMALVGILIYIAVRFEISYGVSAVLGLLHDILVTIGLYVAFGHQFTAPMVAAVLMVIGYSINDTIIIFDRIREELRENPGLTMKEVINLSTNKTLSRTLMTSLTTFIPAFILYLFCSGIVSDYALIFMIGITVGTYSSFFIAAPIFYIWNHGDRKRLDKKSIDAPVYEWMKS